LALPWAGFLASQAAQLCRAAFGAIPGGRLQ
jgi:hypothetical protein